MVLGLEPSDYDIATSARPDEIAAYFPRTQGVGAQFGVMLVIHRGHPFEVATFRSDEAYVDGRRPSGVVFTDARTDVFRRDFTINGLLYDPVGRKIIDFVAGQDDIRDRLVRAIGDPRARFEEDKLRVLRAIRFGARLGYTIEPATWRALCAMAGAIHQVSVERIRDEIVRILTEGSASRGARMLEESGLRREILSDVAWSEHLERSLAMIPRGARPDFGMGVLLHETAEGKAAAVVERLRFSRAEAHHIVELARSAPRFREIRTMALSALKRFFGLSVFEDHL
jgi:poly(A) polymerase